jgi:Glycosyl hydrolase family 63 C-terminal domain
MFQDSVHWSEEHGAYLDYGLHTEDVALERPRPQPHHQPGQRPDKQRVVRTEPHLQFVNEEGYVSKLTSRLLSIVSLDATTLSTGKAK